MQRKIHNTEKLNANREEDFSSSQKTIFENKSRYVVWSHFLHFKIFNCLLLFLSRDIEAFLHIYARYMLLNRTLAFLLLFLRTDDNVDFRPKSNEAKTVDDLCSMNVKLQEGSLSFSKLSISLVLIQRYTL